MFAGLGEPHGPALCGLERAPSHRLFSSGNRHSSSVVVHNRIAGEMSGLQEASEKMQEASTAPAVSMWSLRQGLRECFADGRASLCASRALVALAQQ